MVFKDLSSEFNLDLTVISPSKVTLGNFDNESAKFFLDKEYWHNNLTTWIQKIRCDIDLNCPKSIRESSDLSMGLKFTDDFTIMQLNKTWRNKEEATDVLSFPVLDDNFLIPKNHCIEIGDIVISVTTAKRQAKEMKHDLQFELRWLVSHGLLHLLGWDHPNERALEEMLSCQKNLISMKQNPSTML